LTLVSLFGRPGSGKTTIGAALADRHGFLHLPLGVLLKDPEIVKQIGIDADAMAEAIKSGRTVNDPALYPWLDNQVRSHRKVVVDGYPRGVTSLDPYAQLIETLPSTRSVLALHLDCTALVANARLKLRARSDDDERLHSRHDEYERVQLPMLASLPSRVHVSHVDASGDPDTVYGAVEAALGFAARALRGAT